MRRLNRRLRRKALYGWMWWSPVLVAAFGVLLCDAWLNVQTRKNDYAFSSLNKRIHELNVQIDKLRVQTAGLETMDWLSAKAVELGLIRPLPSQSETINFDPAQWQTAHQQFLIAKAALPPAPVAQPVMPPVTRESRINVAQAAPEPAAEPAAEPMPEPVAAAVLPDQAVRAAQPDRKVQPEPVSAGLSHGVQPEPMMAALAQTEPAAAAPQAEPAPAHTGSLDDSVENLVSTL